MSHHDHTHHPVPHTPAKPHVKWIVIVGVVLMLVAMFAYVMSMDEAVQPDKPIQAPVPAAP